MKISFLKYLTVLVLLISMLESNRIPVISMFSKAVYTTTQSDNGSAEDPVKESENVRVEVSKDYLHQFMAFNFSEPVFLLSVGNYNIFKTKFPYCFYPDVPTPPPNC